jgi:hypothetical protein
MQKKIKLDLEALEIDSFETAAGGSARGTIEGYYTYAVDGCTYAPQATCDAEASCGAVSACDGCYYSQACTADPNDFQCLDSMHYCFESQQTNCVEFC